MFIFYSVVLRRASSSYSVVEMTGACFVFCFVLGWTDFSAGILGFVSLLSSRFAAYLQSYLPVMWTTT